MSFEASAALAPRAAALEDDGVGAASGRRQGGDSSRARTLDLESGTLSAAEVRQRLVKDPSRSDCRGTLRHWNTSKTTITFKRQCTEACSCPVRRTAVCARKGSGPFAGTLRVSRTGEHNHSGDATSGKVWRPETEALAEKFLLEGGHTYPGLLEYFRRNCVPENALPKATQMQSWLKRARKAKRSEQSNSFERVEPLRGNLEAWLERRDKDVSHLFGLRPFVASRSEVLFPFLSVGMIRCLERLEPGPVHIGVDTKNAGA